VGVGGNGAYGGMAVTCCNAGWSLEDHSEHGIAAGVILAVPCSCKLEQYTCRAHPSGAAGDHTMSRGTGADVWGNCVSTQ
jgi:hypothetical protein